MATIGRMEYPELTLSQAIEITEKIGKQNVKTIAGLAQVMGLKSINSGYFYHQVSALTKYFGVMNRTKESVYLTPLGERIAHPLSDSDRRLAMAEAAGRVELLKSLYGALGQSYHEADFKTKLRDVTGASLPELEKATTFIERIYHDAIPYIAQIPPLQASTLTPAGQPSGQPQGAFEMHPSEHEEQRHRAQHSIDASTLSDKEYRTYTTEGVSLIVKRDRSSLREADAMIRAWLELENKAMRDLESKPRLKPGHSVDQESRQETSGS